MRRHLVLQISHLLLHGDHWIKYFLQLLKHRIVLSDYTLLR